METEDKAYQKMNAAITRKQRIKWNTTRHEMWALADYLLDRARFQDYGDSMKRLKALVDQLPLFELDGKGFSRSGTAMEDF